MLRAHIKARLRASTNGSTTLCGKIHPLLRKLLYGTCYDVPRSTIIPFPSYDFVGVSAREELPALRRDLRIKTSAVNHVMAKHGGSLSWAGCAKAERDLTDGFVKLQVKSLSMDDKDARSVRIIPPPSSRSSILFTQSAAYSWLEGTLSKATRLKK